MQRDTHRLTASWRRLGRVKLNVTSGPSKGQEVRIDSQSVSHIRGGRSAVNDIVLDDEHVSGTHFELVLESGGVLLRDLDSTNGIVVGTLRVKEAWLDIGSSFAVGESTIELVSAETIDVPLAQISWFGRVFGQSPVMRELFDKLSRYAQMDRLPLLISGETGTGKELVARALHDHSPRASAPFIAVNCSCINRELAESFLFGHAKGAFTGAAKDSPGCFEAADGGTLFLDEIADLPLELQPKLLRALQEGEVVRVGEHHPRRIDVRVFSATHQDLRRMVSNKEFREDLFFRLATTPIILPSLSERGEDIIHLAELFLEDLRGGSAPMRLSAGAKRRLLEHDWPGNVRELQAVVTGAFYLRLDRGLEIEPTDLRVERWAGLSAGAEVGPELFMHPLRLAREEFERAYFSRLLSREPTLVRAARAAGLSGEGLRLALKRLGLRD